MEGVEECRAKRESNSILRVLPSDAAEQSLHARRLGSAERRFLVVDVVDDLPNGPQRRVRQAKPLDQRLERARLAFMGVLCLKHVESDFTGLRAIALWTHELEARLRIDEAPDEPGAGNPIDVHTFSGDPHRPAGTRDGGVAGGRRRMDMAS